MFPLYFPVRFLMFHLLFSQFLWVFPMFLPVFLPVSYFRSCTTEITSFNILEHNNKKDGREIQQAKRPTTQMVRLQMQVVTTFCNVSVELVPLEKLEHIHPLVKEMFPGELKQNVPLGRKTSHFVQSWEKLTKDQEILEIAKEYKIPLLRTLVQEKNRPLKENQKFIVEKEIMEPEEPVQTIEYI